MSRILRRLNALYLISKFDFNSMVLGITELIVMNLSIFELYLSHFGCLIKINQQLTILKRYIMLRHARASERNILTIPIGHPPVPLVFVLAFFFVRSMSLFP